MQDLIWFVQANWDLFGLVLVSGIAFAEAIVRITPTKTDDGFVTRIGGYIDIALNFLKIPNVKRKSPEDAFKP